MSDFTPDEIKDAFHGLKMIEANIENWKYVDANSAYLPPKQVADALNQILSLTEPIIGHLRSALEIEAITKLDIIDLID
jgi:hypothetical protein